MKDKNLPNDYSSLSLEELTNKANKMIEELEFADNKNIAVVREKLHHYRWMASKLIGIYGDKQEIKQDTNIQITWSNTDQENYKDVTNTVSPEATNSVSHTT